MDSNIYEFGAASTIALYADFIDGCPNDIVMVISTAALSDAAKTALTNSAVKLGYGKDPCCWVILKDTDGAGTEGASADDVALGAGDVHTIVEGLDPAAVIASDATAAQMLGDAFESTALANGTDGHTRILGREILWFKDFESMLEDADQKQQAWALLKKAGR